MAELSFEIAKKLQKPQKGAAGLTLRSVQLCMDEGAESQIIVLAAEYGMIKEQARNNAGIHCRAMGKSLRVYSDDPRALADFAKTLPFNSEEALDVFEFLAPALRSEDFEILSAELEPGSMSVKCRKAMEGEEPDPAEAERFYGRLAAELEKYDMVVIK